MLPRRPHVFLHCSLLHVRIYLCIARQAGLAHCRYLYNVETLVSTFAVVTMGAENRGPELAAVVIALLVFTFVTVALRFYTMGVLMKRLFAEDYLAIITFVSSSPLRQPVS